MTEVRAVSTPVERLEAAQSSQRLCCHRALHWMERAIARKQGIARHYKHTVWCHRSIRIAQVPCDQIVFSVDMAGGAGNDACPGKLCIIQKAAALPNYSRRGIEAADRQLAFENVRTEIHDAQAVGNPVQHIQTLRARAAESQAARAPFVARICTRAGAGSDVDASQNG